MKRLPHCLLRVSSELYSMEVNLTTYKDRLNPWILVRNHLGKPMQVGRFRRRSDADGHLNFLKGRCPEAFFTVMFDPD